MTKKENNIVLLSVSLCWAASYIFIKDLVAELSSYAYLTLTTGIAGILLSIIFFKKLKSIDKKAMLQSFILALLMAIDLLSERNGLATLPSSTASFISSLNILFVPLILLFFHQKLTRNNALGMVIILLGLLTTHQFNIQGFYNMGTVHMIVGCVVMAFYTILSADFTKKSDPLILGIMQINFSAVIGFILWFIEEPKTFASITYSKQMLSSIFILAFFTKAYAYVMLMYSAQYATPFRITVIASTEPVITLFLAILIPNAFGQTESFSIWSLMGALIIAVGAVVAGTDFLSPKNKMEVQKI